MPPKQYVELLKAEIRQRACGVPTREVDTLYFGGGTPSLLEPSDILSIIEELAKEGFRLNPGAEVTIEIDPKTADAHKLDSYLSIGINRFSVGAQSFNDRLLKTAGRRHTSRDVVELLSLLKERKTNYSFDLLFALPTQTLEELRLDVATALSFDPAHVSAYCLTVPEGHKLSYHRAPEDEQIDMFARVEEDLAAGGILRYEISNFAKPGSESRHNLLYWTDQPYLGLGLSSHSYFPRGFSPDVDGQSDWGARFWNVRAMKRYETEMTQAGLEHSGSWSFARSLPEDQIEKLEAHQALTDYFHTALRLQKGLAKNALRLKFGDIIAGLAEQRLAQLTDEKYVEKTDVGWTLTLSGRLVANLVFEKLTFLGDELS